MLEHGHTSQCMENRETCIRVRNCVINSEDYSNEHSLTLAAMITLPFSHIQNKLCYTTIKKLKLRG